MIAASDASSGERAAAVAEIVVFTVLAFFAAHVYATLLGYWSEEKSAPGRRHLKRIMIEQSPMLTVISAPVVILLLGVFEAVDDQNAIDLALYVCLGELAGIAWFASRGAGASRGQSVFAVLGALVIGAAIVAMKAALK